MRIIGLLVILLVVWLPVFGMGAVAAYLSSIGNGKDAHGWGVGLALYCLFIAAPIGFYVVQAITESK